MGPFQKIQTNQISAMLTAAQKKLAITIEKNIGLKAPLYKKLTDKYQSPAGFEDWNTTLRRYSTYSDDVYVSHINKTTNEEVVGGTIVASVGARAAHDLDAPAVYLTRELTEALSRTEANVTQVPELVLPCFFICLPKGVVYCEEGQPITALLVYTSTAYQEWISADLATHKSEVVRSLVDEDFAANTNGLFIAAITHTGDTLGISCAWNDAEPPLDPNEPYRNTSTELERIAKNVILIYNYQKNLISTVEPKTTGTGFGKRQERQTRSPLPTTILGQNFLVSRAQTPSKSGSHTDLTSRRPHWRKGHWHTVLCGVGRTERRLKWFQPVYVNSSLDT